MTDNAGQSTPFPAAEHSERCRDCDAAVGEAHHDTCGAARCLVTGWQRLDCKVDHECGRDVWTGWWPGDLDCALLGWMVQPGVPDLNRLYTEAVWDPQRCLWVKPT